MGNKFRKVKKNPVKELGESFAWAVVNASEKFKQMDERLNDLSKEIKLLRMETRDVVRAVDSAEDAIEDWVENGEDVIVYNRMEEIKGRIGSLERVLLFAPYFGGAHTSILHVRQFASSPSFSPVRRKGSEAALAIPIAKRMSLKSLDDRECKLTLPCYCGHCPKDNALAAEPERPSGADVTLSILEEILRRVELSANQKHQQEEAEKRSHSLILEEDTSQESYNSKSPSDISERLKSLRFESSEEELKARRRSLRQPWSFAKECLECIFCSNSCY